MFVDSVTPHIIISAKDCTIICMCGVTVLITYKKASVDLGILVFADRDHGIYNSATETSGWKCVSIGFPFKMSVLIL